MLQACKSYAEQPMHIGRLHDSVAYFCVCVYRAYLPLPGAFFSLQLNIGLCWRGVGQHVPGRQVWIWEGK